MSFFRALLLKVGGTYSEKLKAPKAAAAETEMKEGYRLSRGKFILCFFGCYLIVGGSTAGMIKSDLYSDQYAWLVFLFGYFGMAVLCYFRFHDLNWSAWYLLIFFLIGSVPLTALFLCFPAGTRGPNRYGKDPLGKKQIGIS